VVLTLILLDGSFLAKIRAAEFMKPSDRPFFCMFYWSQWWFWQAEGGEFM